MSVRFMECMGDADQQIPAAGNGLWTSQTPAAAAIVTDFVNAPHAHSTRFIPGSSTCSLLSRNSANNGAAINTAGFRVNFWIYIAVLPSSSAFLWFVDTIYSEGVGIKITSTGALQLWSMNNTVQVGGTSTLTVSTGKWHRISLAASQTSTSVNAYNLWVDGVLALGLTNVAMNSIGGSTFRVTPNAASTGFDPRFSDMYVDDNTGLTDPGNIMITAKRPVGNGSLNQFTTQIGSGGSGYPASGGGHAPQVNERPLSITDGWSGTPVSVLTEEYTLEAANVGDYDLTTPGVSIIDYMGWISTIEASASNTPVMNMILNGVAKSFTNNTTVVCYIAIGNSSAYPTPLNAIGMNAAYTTTGHLVSLYECGIQFAYFPPSAAPSTPKRRIIYHRRG